MGRQARTSPRSPGAPSVAQAGDCGVVGNERDCAPSTDLPATVSDVDKAPRPANQYPVSQRRNALNVFPP
jgi:hypothetical protein